MTPPINSVSDERLAEMLAGLEGVTPGPWEVAAEGTYPPDEGAKVLGPQGRNSLGHPVRYYVAQFIQNGNAAHIARCDPDTIRALILELQSLRSGNGGEVRAWWCEHGDGSIEVVMWPDARDKLAAQGYAITPLSALEPSP